MTVPRWAIAAAMPFALASFAFAQQYVISTYAGGAPPPTPAAGTAASIGHPQGVATDTAGNVYFSSGHCVFKLDTNGILTRVAGTCRAGYSGDGGSAASAQLFNPRGLTTDSAGNLYIADISNERVRKVTRDGVISTVAGNGKGGYSGDGGPATSAQFNSPESVAVDGVGNLYIADVFNQRIREITPTGIINTVAGNGTAGYSGDGGPAASAQLYQPVSVAVDGAGQLYIADYSNQRVRKVTPDGIITTVAGNGTSGYSGDGGMAASAQLAIPNGVAVDSAGNLYIADYTRIRKVTPTGVISSVAGDGTDGYAGDGGPATSAQLGNTSGVAVDGAGNLYIGDLENNRIRKVAPAGIVSTVAGNGTAGYSGDGGPPTSAQLLNPIGVVVDSAGNLYIADTYNNRIRKVTPTGIITTVAGSGSQGYSGDGGLATSAQLYGPGDMAVDTAGNLYIADESNYRIRKVTRDGVISTVAGNGQGGYSGDGGLATSAQLYVPSGVAMDSAGNLYIADRSNQRIRKVTPSGIISTVAGNGTPGYSGDGGSASSAQLNYPSHVAVDSAGNLYIADYSNNCIRKVTPAGMMGTVAGGGTSLSDGGQATSAQLDGPDGVAVDTAGNLYIADELHSRIRKVAPTGIISTVAGNGTQGYSGDAGPATGAQLNYPSGVAVDSAGNIYIADTFNNAVRLLQPTGLTLPPTITPGGIVPIFSSINTIQPGEWISIYGTNFSSSIASWDGTFSTTLGGDTVTINGKLAALSYVSPLQINAEAPDDRATGSVSVVVTTAGGTASGTVTLAQFAPSLVLLDNKHAAGIIPRSDGTGAYAGGSYDIIGPTGTSLGYQTVAAKAGDIIELYAVGLGPTNPTEPAGKAFVGAAPTTNTVSVLMNNSSVKPSFAGLSGAGLYQINLTVPPGMGTGDVPLTVAVGGAQTQSGVVISLQ